MSLCRGPPRGPPAYRRLSAFISGYKRFLHSSLTVAARIGAVRLNDLLDDPGQVVLHLPFGKMPVNFAQIRDVADVIADPVLGLAAVLQLVAHAGQQVDGLQNGNTILAPATQVVHLPAARRL